MKDITPRRQEVIDLDSKSIIALIKLGLEQKYGMASPFNVKLDVHRITTGIGPNERDEDVITGRASRDLTF